MGLKGFRNINNDNIKVEGIRKQDYLLYSEKPIEGLNPKIEILSLYFVTEVRTDGLILMDFLGNGSNFKTFQQLKGPNWYFFPLPESLRH